MLLSEYHAAGFMLFLKLSMKLVQQQFSNLTWLRQHGITHHALIQETDLS